MAVGLHALFIDNLIKSGHIFRALSEALEGFRNATDHFSQYNLWIDKVWRQFIGPGGYYLKKLAADFEAIRSWARQTSIAGVRVCAFGSSLA